MDPERPRQLKERFDANVALAALDTADIVRMKLGAFGQRLLAQASVLSEPPHFAPKRQKFRVARHRENISCAP
jgi:hypothetical protein